MKKFIIVSIIAYALISSNISLSMFVALAKSTPQPSRSMFYVQRRGFGSIPTLSEERYMALWKNTKNADKELRKLKQNPYSNPNSIDILQKRIDRNRRILNTCQISISADLSDDVIS